MSLTKQRVTSMIYQCHTYIEHLEDNCTLDDEHNSALEKAYIFGHLEHITHLNSESKNVNIYKKFREVRDFLEILKAIQGHFENEEYTPSSSATTIINGKLKPSLSPTNSEKKNVTGASINNYISNGVEDLFNTTCPSVRKSRSHAAKRFCKAILKGVTAFFTLGYTNKCGLWKNKGDEFADNVIKAPSLH